MEPVGYMDVALNVRGGGVLYIDGGDTPDTTVLHGEVSGKVAAVNAIVGYESFILEDYALWATMPDGSVINLTW